MPNRENENHDETFIENKNIIKPEIGIEIDGMSFNYKFFETLESLSKTYSQRKTAKELKVSHSVLNRRIKNAEDKLGEKLVITVGSGSELSEKGYELLELYYKYKNRHPKYYIIFIHEYIHLKFFIFLKIYYGNTFIYYL